MHSSYWQPALVVLWLRVRLQRGGGGGGASGKRTPLCPVGSYRCPFIVLAARLGSHVVKGPPPERGSWRLNPAFPGRIVQMSIHRTGSPSWWSCGLGSASRAGELATEPRFARSIRTSVHSLYWQPAMVALWLSVSPSSGVFSGYSGFLPS